MTLIWISLSLFLIILAYIRFVPSDPAKWHVAPKLAGDQIFNNGAVRVVLIGKDGLRRLVKVVEDDPRSQILVGSTEEGMITFISRSRIVGFPDYTTVLQDGEKLVMLARSRFGRKDFGINAERLDRWIDALSAF
ncbi:DUF1499 domain-containing protein [Pseudopelagicola sp. nBUS_20]|uniref:DUF1499 domain-containing protein n=1 Tax=Pseudopelagicola sp. nBUS_20 TaxID=3395317 RepID=UPI003EBE1757